MFCENDQFAERAKKNFVYLFNDLIFLPIIRNSVAGWGSFLFNFKFIDFKKAKFNSTLGLSVRPYASR